MESVKPSHKQPPDAVRLGECLGEGVRYTSHERKVFLRYSRR